MSENKPGFFKRLFKFGKKSEPEPPAVDQAAAEQAAREEAERAAREAAQKQAAEAEARRREEERLAAEQAAREAEERRRAEEEARAKAEAERLEAEQQAADMRAAEEAKIARQEAEKRLAAQKRREAEAEAARREAERQAKERSLAEEEAARQAQEQEAERLRLQEEQRKADEEAAARKAAEEQAERERLEAQQREEEARAAEEKAQQEAREAEAARKAQEEEAAKQRTEAEKALQAEEARLAEEAARQAQELTAAEARPEDPPEPESEAPESLRPVTESEPELAEAKVSWFKRLKGGLARSSNQLSESISGVFTKRKLDDDTLQDLEDILIRADLGVETAMAITDKLASERMGKDITDEEVREAMAGEIEAVLDPVAAELELDLDHQPHVILVVGVNGSGKTTTIGKLSQKLYDAGFSTYLVAGDTFRAAAIEQLTIWGERTQSPVLSRPLGSDSAALAFDAYEEAKKDGRDVMLMDTAGRLQNKTELMEELRKIIRVLKKQDPEAPHTVLLTLDATTGQNALSQVEIFKDVAEVNGLVMTKLDGTARGGILVAIAAKHKLPVYFIGVGEQVDDLEPFEARDFARSIAGLETV